MQTRKLLLALATTTVIGLASAAPSSALTIGSTLTGSGADNIGGYCPASGTCTGMNLGLPTTAPDGLVSPIDGVITKWRVKSGSAGNPVTIRVLKPNGATSFTGAGTGTSGLTQSGTADFTSNLPIKKGESIALNISNSALVWANTPGATSLAWGSVNGFGGGLADGATGNGQSPGAKELLLQAVVEPAPPVNPNDNTAADITSLRTTPKRFRAQVVRMSQSRRQPGTTIRYRLSEAANVTLRVERAFTVRKSNGRKGTIYRKRGTLTQSGGPGKNTLFFNGIVTRNAAQRTLSPGTYRLRASTVDAAGNRSTKKVTAKFTVLEP